MSLVSALKEIKLHHVVDVEGTRLKAYIPKTIETHASACTGCVFEKEGGAIDCNLRDACMAHKRPDRKSVIFKLFNNKSKK